MLAEGEGFVEYGPPESLVEQMRAADFTPAEFDALNVGAARRPTTSPELELDVMDRVAGRIAEGVDDTYATDVAARVPRASSTTPTSPRRA